MACPGMPSSLGRDFLRRRRPALDGRKNVATSQSNAKRIDTLQSIVNRMGNLLACREETIATLTAKLDALEFKVAWLTNRVNHHDQASRN